jgi:hypothetical protein
MRFIFNKSDRLGADDQEKLVTDLEARLRTDGIVGARIRSVSATAGSGIEELRNDLADAADAKTIVAGKLSSDARAGLDRIARAAGVEPGQAYRPLLDPSDREAATAGAVAGAVAVVDPSGLARQVQAAVLHRARRQGGSLLVRIVTLLSYLTGQRRRHGDPVGYLADWRKRGSLGHVLNPVHRILVEAVASVPAPARPQILKTLGAQTLEPGLIGALDQAVRESSENLAIKGSIVWAFVGSIQLAVGAVFLFAVAWYLTIIFGPGNLIVATTDFPYLGAVPLPLVLLTGSLIVSFMLGAMLSLHARWIGRREGAKLAARVAEAVERTVTEVSFAGLDRVEEARRSIATAARRDV